MIKKIHGAYLALNQKSISYKLKAIVVGTICMRWIFDLGQNELPEFFYQDFFLRLQPQKVLRQEFHISNKTVVTWLLYVKIMLFQQNFIHISWKSGQKLNSKLKRITFSSFSHKKTVKSQKRRKILSRHPFWDIRDICGLKTFQTSFFGVFSWLCSWLFRNVSIGPMGAETVGNILTYLWPLSIFVTKKYAFFAIFWHKCSQNKQNMYTRRLKPMIFWKVIYLGL